MASNLSRFEGRKLCNAISTRSRTGMGISNVEADTAGPDKPEPDRGAWLIIANSNCESCLSWLRTCGVSGKGALTMSFPIDSIRSRLNRSAARSANHRDTKATEPPITSTADNSGIKNCRSSDWRLVELDTSEIYRILSSSVINAQALGAPE